MTITRTNDEWVDALRAEGEAQQAALTDLRALLVSRLPYALNRWLPGSDPRLEPLVEEVAQLTLLRVLERLTDFEGRSAFTTWVYKIAVRLALTELRRKRWETVSLDGLVEDEESPAPERLLADPTLNTHAQVEAADLIGRVYQIIEQELTEKQRQAMLAVGVKGLKMDQVAEQMGTNRNALYKLMYDARMRLKRRLAQEGLSPEDVLDALG